MFNSRKGQADATTSTVYPKLPQSSQESWHKIPYITITITVAITHIRRPML